MRKKHGAEFRLKLVREHLSGNSITRVSKEYEVPKTLLKKWISHYQLLGVNGLFPKPKVSYSRDFKLKAIESYLSKELSLRECCLRYNIPSDSTLLNWVRKYEESGLDSLLEKRRGRPKLMKDKPSQKKVKPLTRLEALEKENLYLRAENELLKKLEALAQQKEAQKKKR
ncbi:helix-turn-helix domain-containing protein [Solitalea sp. MAHUQ-68]|uniref:Helix-turn-helix domain-containing protein n=1 Tax=Solitalea agri TaxID=2953739 RepID=A0A9X2EZZ0_9SPHI|nr:helix-turn-helix domain-containing protein [Solitalea agri]MCO4292187.1 helix-turn-helix domain-containing protein [Solitalea agri]